MIKTNEFLASTVLCSPTLPNKTPTIIPSSPPLPSNDTAIADTGASDIYLTPNAPVINIDTSAPKVRVGTATGAPQLSAGTGEVNLSQLPAECRTGQIMPTFAHNLMGIGPLCDANCKVLFTADDVTVYDRHSKPILRGWRETDGAKLWRFSLREEAQAPPTPTSASETTLQAYSAYDLPSVEALVRYFHAAAGFPVKSTWLAAIKAGNYATWPGLTYSNAAKYCPKSEETLKGHMAQTRQGVRSTKVKVKKSENTSSQSQPIDSSPDPSALPTERSNEMHIWVEPISKLYTDDTGRFPIRSRKGNQYIMIAYHCDSNTILTAPFKTKSDKHRIEAYNSIMKRIKARGHKVDLQILDNECSAEYKRVMEEEWNIKFQLVPPEVHRRNIAERAIRTFKDHFLATLAGVAADFPPYLWDILLEQAEITVNLLRQATLNPRISAWEYFNGPFDYNATPLGPLGSRVIIHNKASSRKSWDQRGESGWYVGPALVHYRCYTTCKAKTKALAISDTIEFCHDYLIQPSLTPEDRLVHAMNILTCALKDAPAAKCNAQLMAIQDMQELFGKWRENSTASNGLPAQPPRVPTQPPRVLDALPHAPSPTRVPVSAIQENVIRPSPLQPQVCDNVTVTHNTTPPPIPPPVASPPRVPTQPTRAPAPPQTPTDQPVAHRTRSRQPLANIANVVTPANAASRKFPLETLLKWAMPVLNEETGLFMEYRELRKHPHFSKIWNNSASNELGRLLQGIGEGDQGQGNQRVDGTDTFRVIKYEDIPPERRKEICFTSTVCKVRPEKNDPNRTRITIAGTRIIPQGDVGTPTGSLELAKLVINSVLSRKGAKFACFDIENFYLGTPLDRPEYVKMKLSDIPQEVIDEYNLLDVVRDGWVYFSVHRGCYGLPQSGKLANDLLTKRLGEQGYYPLPNTPGLWKHKWRPVMFTLTVDDFGIEYVGKEHALHLLSSIEKFYNVTVDWEGKKFVGLDLKWDYTKRTCRLTMDGYVEAVLRKYGHIKPSKPQLSPHKHRPIVYGSKGQDTPEEDTSAKLDDEGIKRVQGIVGALLYYARAVDNKLLVGLSAIGSQQAAATEQTMEAVNQILDYAATYPSDGITYRASDMILAAHSDAGYLNESKARSRAGAHIFLSEDDPYPRFNGPLLTIAQIIKFVMSSAAEAELAALFITAKELVPIRQTLEEMGWPQPKTPIQTDNSTAVGVVNNTIIQRKMKSMDMRLWWLRCREAQGQFRFYWDKGANNWADYSTKHHPAIYHEAHRSTHAG